MGLTRRQWLLSLPWIATVASACGTLRRSEGDVQRPYVELLRGEGTAPHCVLVFMPDTEQTRQVWTGLSDELGTEVQLIGVKIESRSDARLIGTAIERHRPSALVLVNNPTVAAYREYQRRSPSQSYPPSVVVMTSLLEHALGLTNATGILYEVPLVTAVTGLRRLLDRPISRVGVIHRADFRAFVESEAKLALREKVSVIGESISGAVNASEINSRSILSSALKRCGCSTTTGDQRQGSPGQGRPGGVNEQPWIPTIVGAGSLVSAHGSFGDIAILPDLNVGLGAQTALIVECQGARMAARESRASVAGFDDRGWSWTWSACASALRCERRPFRR